MPAVRSRRPSRRSRRVEKSSHAGLTRVSISSKEMDCCIKSGNDGQWKRREIFHAMTSTDDPLVSSDWLAARLDDPTVKIIDASYKMPGVLPLPSADYPAPHIPAPRFFHVAPLSHPNTPRP